MVRWFLIGNINCFIVFDVCCGEFVMIWCFGDVDEFWWIDMFIDDKGECIICCLEIIIWVISNNVKENVVDILDSIYWIEWSMYR